MSNMYQPRGITRFFNQTHSPSVGRGSSRGTGGRQHERDTGRIGVISGGVPCGESEIINVVDGASSHPGAPVPNCRLDLQNDGWRRGGSEDSETQQGREESGEHVRKAFRRYLSHVSKGL